MFSPGRGALGKKSPPVQKGLKHESVGDKADTQEEARQGFFKQYSCHTTAGLGRTGVTTGEQLN